MATQTWNKLVRDRVPDVIRSNGSHAETRILETKEYLKALREKIIEEATELERAHTVEDLKGEIADVLEVAAAIAKAYGIPLTDVRVAQEKKRAERGGFTERIFLISTTDAT